MVDVENYGSKLKNFDIGDNIESEATKVEVGDNFAVILKSWRMETHFLLFCVIKHYTIVKPPLKMVGGTNGTRVTCF
jgi:hypothetical protein